MSASPPTSRHPSADEVAQLVLALSGVRGARVVRRRGGEPLVRLRLAAGADPAEVCRDVGGLLAPPPPPAEPAEGTGAPMTATPVRPSPTGRSADPAEHADPPAPAEPPGAAGSVHAPRTPVPPLGSPAVASTPAPDWLDRDADDAVAADRARADTAGTRVHLRRVRVTTEGTTTVAEVVLTRGEVVHTGIADAVATPAGTSRALAGATTRCLESVTGGSARLEVDGVQVDVVAGQLTAVVCLSIVTARGHEQLSGSALVLGDPHRAVVRAVLAAANRRVSLSVADHDGAP